MNLKKADILFLLFLMSCKGPFSTLDPAGNAAKTISDMFWWLLGGAVVIWIIFVSIEAYAVLVKPGTHDRKKTKLLVIGGGVLFPVIIITFTVIYSLRPLPKLIERAPEGSLTVKVSGLQWWWRVTYEYQGKPVELANEIWLPVGKPVQFILESEDVIHSFWVPSLAGKMDMLPGRKTHLSFTPEKEGEYLGICAEYCGDSHALMRMNVKVVEENKFNQWLRLQSENALKPESLQATRGEQAFLKNGCIACHSVRGVSEIGRVGPDLTHVGSRSRIGAGILINDFHNLKKWMKKTTVIKPGVKMPTYETISQEEREDISHWLQGLK